MKVRKNYHSIKYTRNIKKLNLKAAASTNINVNTHCFLLLFLNVKDERRKTFNNM